jgi:hypothetical protein
MFRDVLFVIAVAMLPMGACELNAGIWKLIALGQTAAA